MYGHGLVCISNYLAYLTNDPFDLVHRNVSRGNFDPWWILPLQLLSVCTNMCAAKLSTVLL